LSYARETGYQKEYNRIIDLTVDILRDVDSSQEDLTRRFQDKYSRLSLLDRGYMSEEDFVGEGRWLLVSPAR